MAFVYKGQLNGADNPVIRNVLIKNSAHVAVGEALTFSSGADSASVGEKILGICVGIVDKDGIGLDNTAWTIDGTWASSTKTYTAAADNMTVGLVRAQVITDKDALFRCDANASISAAEECQKFNLTSATEMDGGAGVDAAGQFELVKYDPEGTGDASMGLYKICESFGDAYAQQ
jgi:hypothetical protein